MATILTPGFLKWDGLKFVLDDVSGEAGPPGPPGAGEIVYRPGGTQAGNVYTTWEAAMDARADIEGPATIIVDDQLGDAFVDAGTWDLTKNTRIKGYRLKISENFGQANESYPILSLVSNATLLNPSDFENINIVGEGGLITAGPSGNVMDLNLYDAVLTNGSSAMAPLVFINEGTINLYRSSKIIRTGGTVTIQDEGFAGDPDPITSAHSVIINLYDSAILDGYAVSINGNVDAVGVNQILIININSAGAVFLTSQAMPGFPETYSIRRNVNVISAGPNFDRPDAHSRQVGQMYFDTTLNQPIWFNGTDWVDANGEVVG